MSRLYLGVEIVVWWSAAIPRVSAGTCGSAGSTGKSWDVPEILG